MRKPSWIVAEKAILHAEAARKDGEKYDAKLAKRARRIARKMFGKEFIAFGTCRGPHFVVGTVRFMCYPTGPDLMVYDPGNGGRHPIYSPEGLLRWLEAHPKESLDAVPAQDWIKGEVTA